jgi:hypothetical protein
MKVTLPVMSVDVTLGREKCQVKSSNSVDFF